MNKRTRIAARKHAALLVMTALAWSASAQNAAPPVRELVDGNGVDLMTGTLTAMYQGISVGPSVGGLVFTRTYRKLSHWDSLIGMVTANGQGGTTFTVSVGGQSERFSWNSQSAVFTPMERLGSTLTATVGSPGFYTYTTRTGMVAQFTPRGTDYRYPGTTAADYRASMDWIQFPDGERIDVNYHTETICVAYGGSGGGSGCTSWRTASRIASITSNYGYKFQIDYGANSNPYAVDPNAFVFPAAVTAINMASGAVLGTMNLFLNGAGTEYQLTDPAGRTAIYTRTLTDGITGIRRPGSATNNVVVTYTSGKVTSATNDGLQTTYAYVDSGSNRTTTVTQPGGGQRVLTFDMSKQQLVSARDELNRTTSYVYDNFSRLTRMTAPEGNYVEYTYDDRGNITQTRAVAKPGSGLADIVTSASFDASCANAKTCNKPNWTRDAKGNQTDYTYDPTHGALLTVTLPAPSPGTARPQTRFSYTALEAWYRNSSGVLAPSGRPIYKLTGISTCSSASSCTGTADERKTVIGYGSAGIANNLLPVSVTTSDGTGASVAVTGTSYDAAGNPIGSDGPLAGSADTTQTRYDVLRRIVGVIGPDPDGSGPRVRMATRHNYDLQGRLVTVETGTVPGTSDSDWSAFASLQSATIDYDSANRRTRATLQAGGAAHAVQQFSYDAVGRLQCLATRMNPNAFAAAPASACDLGAQGAYGPDRIVRLNYNAAHQTTQTLSGYGTTNQIAVNATYTNNGLLETIDDGKGNRTTHQYDGFDRLIKTLYPHVATTGTSSTSDFEEVLSFDANSNATSIRLRNGSIVTLGYDNLDRMTLKDLPENATDDVYYAYDNLGRLLSARFGSPTGAGVVNTFDSMGRSVSTASFGRTVGRVYDLAANQFRVTHPDGFYATYSYSAAGELTSIVDSTNTTLATYTYDNLGRRTGIARGNGTSTVAQPDAIGRLQSLTQQLAGTSYDGTATFAYTPSFQLATRTQSNDLTYTWTPPGSSTVAASVNGLNRLTAFNGASIAHDSLGNVTNDGARVYGYNSENRLISASGTPSITLRYDPLGMLNRLTGSDGSETQFLYDGPDLIAEYSSSGAIVRRYVHGAGIDEPIVWYEGATPSNANRRYLHADERGSIVAVSDNAGNGIASYAYSPDGLTTAGGSRFKYTGQVALPEIGLYYYKARMYSPRLGRFMQSDPIGYAGGMNLYAYAGADPINSIDPSGTDPDSCCGGTIDIYLSPRFSLNPGYWSNVNRRGDQFHYDYLVRSAQLGGAPVNGYCQPACTPPASGNTQDWAARYQDNLRGLSQGQKQAVYWAAADLKYYLGYLSVKQLQQQFPYLLSNRSAEDVGMAQLQMTDSLTRLQMFLLPNTIGKEVTDIGKDVALPYKLGRGIKKIGDMLDKPANEAIWELTRKLGHPKNVKKLYDQTFQSQVQFECGNVITQTFSCYVVFPLPVEMKP